MTSRRVSRRAVSQSRKSIEGWAQTQALPVKVVGVVLGDPDRLALPLPQPHEEGLLLDVVALARAQQQVPAGRVEGHAQTAAREPRLWSRPGTAGGGCHRGRPCRSAPARQAVPTAARSAPG